MSEDRERGPTSPLEGRYANDFRIGFNAHEFLLEFGQLQPEHEGDEGRYHTRIVIMPANTQRLLAVLQESTEAYERSFGVIRFRDG